MLPGPRRKSFDLQQDQQHALDGVRAVSDHQDRGAEGDREGHQRADAAPLEDRPVLEPPRQLQRRHGEDGEDEARRLQVQLLARRGGDILGLLVEKHRLTAWLRSGRL
jgi:hypothetical protein